MTSRFFYVCFALFFLFTTKINAQSFIPEWVNPLNGQANSVSTAIAKDQAGNIYISGRFSGSVNFNPQGAPKMLNASMGTDIFVAKYAPNGACVWAFGLDGNGNELANSMTVDNDGNVLITGQFGSTVNFNPQGNNSLTTNGGDDIFVAKYTNDGAYLWARALGGGNNDRGHYVVTDNNNNVFITAIYSSPFDADPSAGTYILPNDNYSFRGFFAKYTPEGNFVWAHPLGSGNGDGSSGTPIAIDKQTNDVVIAGDFSTRFDFSFNNTPGATIDVQERESFLARYSNDGTYQWVKHIRTDGSSLCASVLINSKSEIVLFSRFNGRYYPEGPNGQYIQSKNEDVVLSTYTSTGSLEWVKSFGSTNATTNSYFACIDEQDNIAITGQMFGGSVDFDPDTENGVVNSFGGSSIYMAQYNSTGKAISSGIIGGDCGSNISYEIAASNGAIYLTGGFCSTVDFDPSPCGSLSRTTGYETNIYLTKYIVGTPTGIANAITPPAVTSFCGQADADVINGDTPTGTNITYQWQQSADSITFTNISGATARDYDPPVANATTYYRRVINLTDCNMPTPSNVVTITVTNTLSNNQITAPSATTFCGPGNPDIMIGSAIAGSAGSFTYQWQQSADNVTFTDIAGATGKDYDAPVTNTTTYFRRIVISSACTPPPPSNVVTITIASGVNNNQITAPANMQFCGTGNAAVITGTTPTVSNGTFTYQWQQSTDNVTFADITGATLKDYDPPLVNTTTWYRRLVTGSECNTPSVSNVVEIMISAPPAVPVLTETVVTVCEDGTATFTIASPQQGITYNWYGGPNRVGFLQSGTSLTQVGVNANYPVYVEASNGTCNSAETTGQIVVTGRAAEPRLNQPDPVCSGQQVTLSINNTSPGNTYSWYTTATGGTPVATGPVYTFAATTTITYFAEASNGNCPSYRTGVEVTVIAAPMAPAVNGATICPGNTTTLTATAGSGETVNWYTSASSNSPVYTGDTYTTPALSDNTTYYVESINQSGCPSAQRTQVTVSMLTPLPAPVVSTRATTTNTVVFSWPEVTGATGYEVSVNNGSFTNIGNINSYTATVQQGQSVTLVVRALGNESCETSSNSAAVSGVAIDPVALGIYVPNMFSPNNDGNNDVLYVRGPGIKNLTFYVYDQWGKMIFRSTDLSVGWDGTFSGSIQPVGVYVYYVDAVMLDGKKATKKGTITLLR